MLQISAKARKNKNPYYLLFLFFFAISHPSFPHSKKRNRRKKSKKTTAMHFPQEWPSEATTLDSISRTNTCRKKKKMKMNEWENGVSLDQFFSHIHEGRGRREGNGTLKNLKEGGKGNWEKAAVYKLAVMFWSLVMTCRGFPQKYFF